MFVGISMLTSCRKVSVTNWQRQNAGKKGGCSKTQRHTDFVKNKNQGKVEIKFVQKVTI